jgi:hypothetical protein
MQTALTESMRTRIAQMGFGGILNLATRSLDNRDFLSWLMDCFNPIEMTIVIGGKHLQITENAVRCVFDLPNTGIDPPMPSEDEAKKKLMDVATRLFPAV